MVRCTVDQQLVMTDDQWMVMAAGDSNGDDENVEVKGPSGHLFSCRSSSVTTHILTKTQVAFPK